MSTLSAVDEIEKKSSDPQQSLDEQVNEAIMFTLFAVDEMEKKSLDPQEAIESSVEGLSNINSETPNSEWLDPQTQEWLDPQTQEWLGKDLIDVLSASEYKDPDPQQILKEQVNEAIAMWDDYVKGEICQVFTAAFDLVKKKYDNDNNYVVECVYHHFLEMYKPT